MSYKVYRLISITCSILQKFLCSLLITSLDYMTVEKVISHYNQIKFIHRLTTSDEIIYSTMFVILIGIDSAVYDPRPAVARFLRKKERRYANQIFLCARKNILFKIFSEKMLVCNYILTLVLHLIHDG